MTTEPVFTRRAYTGSCHCGNVKYIAHLTLPSLPEGIDGERFRAETGLRSYKCNCNTCRKMNIFHLRLKFAPDDFLLLSPVHPEADDSTLTNYMTSKKRSSWWFCKACGVRCFTVRAATENTRAKVPIKCLQKLGVKQALRAPTDIEESVVVPVWKLTSEGFAESSTGDSYFNLNAVTLDSHQEGLDLAKWHENQWIQYIDSLDESRDGGWQTGQPHAGGIY